MIISVHFPDGGIVDVAVDDAEFERTRAMLESKGQTFEEGFVEYLQEFLDQHPILAQGKTVQ